MIFVCENSGGVNGNDNVGGNVGYNDETIEGECNNSGEVKGEDYVGGNVGYNNKLTITGDCKNKGAVTGEKEVGGNIGRNKGEITGDCKNYYLDVDKKITGKKDVGFNVGYNDDKGSMFCCCEVIGKNIPENENKEIKENIKRVSEDKTSEEKETAKTYVGNSYKGIGKVWRLDVIDEDCDWTEDDYRLAIKIVIAELMRQDEADKANEK